jgi:hypothetical protein
MMRFKRKIATAVVLVGAALASGCGSATATHSTTAPSATAQPGTPPAFAWLHPAPAPPAWRLARLTGAAVLAYPSSWQRIHSDPGTVSAALTAPGSDVVTDYLNVTPRQGEETVQNWARFRPDHNREEGDSHVELLAAAQGLRFRDGRGSCVIDRYRTPRTTYQEIACLVGGPRGANVIVAAGLASRWAEDAPALERAVSAFLA